MEARLNGVSHCDGAAMRSRAVKDSSEQHVVATTVEIIRAANRLSAVATPDWCDRAAACLALMSEDCVAVVMLVEVNESGAIATIEAAGAAVRRRNAPCSNGTHAVSPNTSTLPSEERLVSRAQRMVSIGWQPLPDGLHITAAGLLSEQPGGMEWRSQGVGRLWMDVPTQCPLVGLTPVSPARWLSVNLARASLPWNAVHATILAAVLPVLGGRLHLPGDGGQGSRWLTTREQEVLERLTRGESVRQIAVALGRSPHTVHDHIKSLHRKLGARTRGELIVRALGHSDPTPARIHDEEAKVEPLVVQTRIATASPAA